MSATASSGVYPIEVVYVNGTTEAIYQTANPSTITVGSGETSGPSLGAAPGVYTSGDLTVNYFANYGGAVTVDENGIFTIAATAKNYVIDTICVDGIPLDDLQGEDNSEYEFEDTDGTHSIVATFAHTINFQPASNGSLVVTRNGQTSEPLNSGDIVRDGEILIITATPDDGCELGELTLTGFENNNPTPELDGTYTVTVLAPRGGPTPSVTAAFVNAARPVTIASSITHGTVTATPTSAAPGSTVTLTVASEAGYRLKSGSLKVNSGAVEVSGADPQFTFAMPDGTATVTAEFEAIPVVPWDGSGTGSDPFLIASNTDFIALRDKVNAGESYSGDHFRLTADLDLRTSETNWTPVGNINATPFSGIFDGGGKKITVNIDDTTTQTGDCRALFSKVLNAEFRNLTVDGSVKGYNRAGGIIGRAEGTLLIENCENRANVSAASEFSAGIVASTQQATSATIKDCRNYGSITTPKSTAAGILARSGYITTVTGCVNYGTIGGAAGVTGSGAVGIAAVVGQSNSQKALITNCANFGEVSGGQGAEGIGGGQNAVIRNSYNAGTISGGYMVSGIGSGATITDCYNAGTVTGLTATTAAGGISGIRVQSIANCYNSGAVSSVNAARAGGILGSSIDAINNAQGRVTITNSYFLDSSAAVGANPDEYDTESVTDEDLRSLASTLGTAFMDTEDGYPILAWQLGDDNAAKTQTVSDGVVNAVIKGGDLSAFTDSSDGTVYASFDLTNAGNSAVTNATIQNRTLKAFVEASATLRLETDAGTLTFDAAALSEIAAAAGTSDVTLTAAKLATSSNSTAQALITAGAPVYEFTLKAGETQIFTDGANTGSVSVVLPYTRKGTAQTVTVKVNHIAENGAKTEVTDASYSNGDKNVSFTTNHFSLYAIEEVARQTTGGSSGEGGVQGGKPDSLLWDGETIDVRWYTPGQSTYYISDGADLAGLAAIVNGIYNEDIIYIVGDDSHTKIVPTWSTDGDPDGPQGNNMSTARYAMGTDDFANKTVILGADINMGSANYMPIGGQYLMAKNDSTTKISASFNGTFDGGGHSVTLYTDRHCSNGNFGDGSSVGLIGRLGVHDSETGVTGPDLRATTPTVKNVAVYGSVRGNRSVGGIVGKIGKTVGGGIIENCANFADVSNTDAKGVGGIVGAGWNGGVVRNCYNAGNISSSYTCPTGGISGSNEITLENCYNVGKISAASTSFAMAIGTNNGGAPYATHVINSYFLAGSAPGGGYYDGAALGGEGFTAQYMKSDEFVSDLNAGSENGAYVKDSRNINSGYPVLAWQGGTTVNTPIGGTDSTESNETETPAPEVVSQSTIETAPVKPDDTGKAAVTVETAKVTEAVAEAV
ncbi:MAG: hypothetical protein LBS51_07035, partial [Oscillospiraceae bacterium]|nr:hypothetical protein [Oscillospiraceae bacterium]